MISSHAFSVHRLQLHKHSMFFLKLHSTARVSVEPVAMTPSLTDGWILWTLVFSEIFTATGCWNESISEATEDSFTEMLLNYSV